VEKRMSKMLAIIFALALAFAYSCGGGGSSSGGAAGYTPDNAPSSTGTTTLSTTEKVQVEQEVSMYITMLGGAYGGATSKAATKIDQCIDIPDSECSGGKYCVEGDVDQNGGDIKISMVEDFVCEGMTYHFFEYDINFDYSSDYQMNIKSAAGAIDIEWDEQFNVQNFRVFVKWDKGGSVEGWIAENGVKTGEIGGTTTNPTITWL